MKGFSPTNLKYCKRFYLFYTQGNSNRQQVADDLNLKIADEQLGENKEIEKRLNENTDEHL